MKNDKWFWMQDKKKQIERVFYKLWNKEDANVGYLSNNFDLFFIYK